MSRSDAVTIATDVACGRRRAEAVIEETLADVARANPALNAFTAVLADEARSQARRLDVRIAAGDTVGPLAGVPFAAKNLFDVQGVTTIAGSIILKDAAPAARDAAMVARLRAAGAILVGLLNMDEFAYGFVTENAHYGPTHNPHDLACIAGGSSGGSAAAVAAGLTPLALGSDTNGSIRVPAGLCGIFGLKPTFGRLSREGVFPFVDSLDHAGVFARTVRDLALAYDVMQGDGDSGRAADTVSAKLISLSERRLRVGVLEGWFQQGAFPEVRESLDRVAGALAAARGVELPGAEAARSAAFCLTTYEGARLHRADVEARPQDFDPAVRDRLLAGLLLPDEVAVAARRYRPLFRDEARAVFERFDILLAPATPCTAPRIGQATMTLAGEVVTVRPNLGAYTQPLSFIGVPIVTAPVNRPGLMPVGIQIIAAPWREDLALAAALRLENLGVVAAHAPPAAADQP